MNTILFLSLVSIVSSLAIAYISLKFAKSEEAEIVMKSKLNIQIIHYIINYFNSWF